MFLLWKIDQATIYYAYRHKFAASASSAVRAAGGLHIFSTFRTQTTLIDRDLRANRLLAFLSSGFGLIALTLAAAGLGGLLAYAMARRAGEIGARVALGAAPADGVRARLLGSSFARADMKHCAANF